MRAWSPALRPFPAVVSRLMRNRRNPDQALAAAQPLNEVSTIQVISRPTDDPGDTLSCHPGSVRVGYCAR